jgi:EPS-associated MarR family transcriptional regulator
MDPQEIARDGEGTGAPAVPDELRYRLLTLLQQNPEMSQRELAAALGMSLGKANYCINALIRRGLVKVRNFQNSKNKAAYAYLLTPRGIEEKAEVTIRFLRMRMAEYDALAQEIERLKHETTKRTTKHGDRR